EVDRQDQALQLVVAVVSRAKHAEAGVDLRGGGASHLPRSAHEGSASAILTNSARESCSALALGSIPAEASTASVSAARGRSAIRIVFRRAANPAATARKSRLGSTSAAG